MPINEPSAIAVQDDLRSLALQLDNASHKNRGVLIRTFAELHDWSNAKVYRMLKNVGWSSGRKTRADKGTTSQCMETLKDVTATLRLGVRKNGKVTMQVPNAVSLLQSNGRKFNVTHGRVSALLKARQMDIQSQKKDRAHQRMRSLHPNHVHMVDPSLCLIYYLKDGSQHIMRDDQFYKNKPENIAKVKNLKVWRYVLVDHYSHTIVVRYYQSKGETQANLYDFLLYAWKQLDGRAFHGVPKVLYWDKGSANTAKAIAVALKALGVEALTHQAGNPRAKGSVEVGNDMTEKLFESRLRYEPVNNVDELNTAVEGWYNAYNSNTVPHYDSRLNRKFMDTPMARYAIWQIIREEQLTILPDESVCRYLLSAEPIGRKVNADLTISFKHPNTKQREFYDVSHLPGVYPNAIIQTSPLIYGNRQVLLTFEDYKGEEFTFVVEPLEVDRFGGFSTDAAVIGLEYKQQPDTVVEKAGKEADKKAFPDMDEEEIKKAKNKNATPFNGELDAHSHLQNVDMPSYIKRPGSELSVPDRFNVESKPLSKIEVSKLLVRELNRPLKPEEQANIKNWYPDGVPEDQFDILLQRLTQPQHQSGSLSVVK